MPQDSLTLKFQEQLRKMRKTGGITDVTPMPPQQQVQRRQGGRSLAEIAGMQGDYKRQPDDTGNALTALAKGAWTYAETVTFGFPKLLYGPIESLTGLDIREAAQPKGFQERVAVGIGGAAGFMQPMKWVGNILTKGVAKWAPGGINKFSKRFVDDSVKIMEKDKKFSKWVKAKVKQNETGGLNEREFIESLLEQPISKLGALGTQVGASRLAHTVKHRTNFAKSFRDASPKAILKKLTENGFGIEDATRITAALGDDIAKNIGTVTEGTKSLFKFPALRLNQVIGQATNNSRLGNLAGHALEEAALFAAVETTMLGFESAAYDDVDFLPNLGGTLKHAVGLGSVLGVLRMIPGGRDMPIMRTGWSRVTGLVKNKRRFRKYELEPDKARGIGAEIYLADRKKFALEVKNVYENNAGFFSHLRKIQKADKKRALPQDYRVPISERHGLRDIDNLMKTPKGRTELKRTMIDAENAFFRDWYPRFLKEIPGDLGKSSLRMMSIALAFNFETFMKWMSDESIDMELEDVVFHAALGMFMGKRGHSLPYTDSRSGKLKTVFKERPYAMSEDFKKVDKYLEALGVNLDVGLYRAIYNEGESLARGLGGAKLESKDMQKLKKIVDRYKLVVPKYTGETTDDGRPVTREKTLAEGKDSTSIDEVYADLAAVARHEFVPEAKVERDITKEEIGELVNEYEVKESYELTDKQLKSLKKDLAEAKFDALISLSPDSPGAIKSGDILNIHQYYMEPYATEIRDINRQAYLDMYNEILKQNYEKHHEDLPAEQAFKDFQWDKADGPIEVNPVDWGDGRLVNAPSSSIGRHLIGPDSNINRLLRPHLVYKGPKIIMTQEMVDKIFGEFKEGKRVTPWGEAVIDKHMDALNKVVFGDEAVVGQEYGRKLHLGDQMIQSFLEDVLSNKSIREHWQVLNDFITSKNTTNAFTKDDFKKINTLYSDLFVKEGNLSHRIELIKNTRDKTKLSESKYSREYSFINSFNEILKFHQKTGDVGGLQSMVAGRETVKHATVSDVRALMKVVNEKLPLFDYPEQHYYQQQYKSDMIARLQEFASNESLAGLKTTDGKPLTPTGRAKVMTLMQSGAISPKMRMMDIRGVRNDFQKLFEAFKRVKKEDVKKMTKLEDFVDYMASKQQDTFGVLINRLKRESGVVNNTFEAIMEASKITGLTPETFSKTLFDNLDKHIKPFLAGSKPGFGFIKPSEIAAVVDAAYLAKLVGQLDVLNYNTVKITHEALNESIRENLGKKFTNQKASDTQINDLLKLVYNISHNSPSKASMAQSILARSGVYNETNQMWNWEEFADKPKVLRQTIRDVEAQLNLGLTILPSSRSLELVHQRDRLDSESRYPSDSPVTISLDKYAKKYKIKHLANYHGQSLSKVLREDLTVMDSSLNFYEFMKKGAMIVHEGNQYASDMWDGNNKLNDKHIQFMYDSNSIYGRLINQKTSRRIHVADSIENPKWEEYTHQDNGVYKVIKDVSGEITFIDANYITRGDDGIARPYNIKLDSTPSNYESEFLKHLAEKAPVFKKGTGTREDILKAQASGDVETGYIPVFLGTHGSLIGVPLARTSVGTSRNSPSMNRIVQSFIEEYKKYKSVISKEAVEAFEKEIEIALVDRNAEDVTEPINLNSDGWEYKEGMKNYEFMSRDFTMMLTNVVGSKTMGKEWWDASKGENWWDGEALAKKQLRYMRQLFNASAKRMDKTLLKDLVKMLDSPNMEFLPNSIRGNKKSIKKSLKDWIKRDTRWHYWEDEASIPGEALPELSSLHKRLKKQIDAEEAARAEVEPGFKMRDMTEQNSDGDFVFPGGIDDASMFDSINIVSKSKMEAAKFVHGVSDSGIETIKAIGGLPSGTDGVWIDKTVWITSNAWESYLKRNNIDGVKIGSSVKLAGERHLGAKGTDGKYPKGLYMKDYNTMEDLLSKTHGEDKVITLPIETFAISQFHKADKKATQPIQLSADLTTAELNQSFFEWKFKRPLQDFLKDSGRTFGAGDISSIMAKLRTEDMEATTEQLAAQELWNGMNNDPTFFPFSRNVRNDLMRQFLFDRGVFTPFDEFGTQGNMVSTFADFGSARDLRFTTFTKDAKTGFRKPWTYGEIEIDIINRNKLVNTDRLRLNEWNAADRDRLVTPKEKLKKDVLPSVQNILPKDLNELLKRNRVKLGEVYDKLEDFNKTLEGKKYQVVIVSHRTPTTRPSDKVIVALKGFGEDGTGKALTGNSVRINHADAWHRLEADHDLDKLNYWWDTPENILREWDEISGKVASIKGTQDRNSIEGLNAANGEMLINYNKSDRNSQFYRGIVVKSRRLLQFFKYYQNEKYKDVKGFSIKLGKDRIVLADEAQIDRVEKQIAEDIQRIVDAQGRGYDKNIFNDGWFDRILFGDGVPNSSYPGMFIRQKYISGKKKNEWETIQNNANGVALGDLEMDIIRLVIKPYQRLLQLQTNIFENGEAKKVDYDSLIDYVDIYKKSMYSLNRSVYYKLLKKGYKSDDLDSVFKTADRRDFIDPFNLNKAKYSKDSKSGDGILEDNPNMLAADRMIGVIGSHDRLRMPHIDYKNKEITDDIILDATAGNFRDVAETTSRLYNAFKEDMSRINALNSIDSKIKKYRGNADKQRRFGNSEIAAEYSNHADNLKQVRNRLETRIMANPKTQAAIREKIIEQIENHLAAGRTWRDAFGNKYNYAKHGYDKRLEKINGISKIIARNVWDYSNNKLGVKVKGIGSDDYLQTLAVYNVMSEITGAGLNPEIVGKQSSMEWNQDIRQFRYDYGKMWSDKMNEKLDTHLKADDIVNDAFIQLEDLYYKWERVEPGLGRYFVLSTMTPEMNPNVVTYHKGYLMPGFSKTTTQGKFITLGLKFFGRQDSQILQGVIRTIGRPISNQIAFLRGRNSDMIIDETTFNEAMIRNRTPVDFESEGGSPLIDYSGAESRESNKIKLTQIKEAIEGRVMTNEDMNFQNMNEHILRTIGLTGNISLDYIAYRAPALGLKSISALKRLSEFDFIPSNAITRSGHVVPLTNFNDYMRHKKNQAFMFIGPAMSKRNLFTGKAQSTPPEINGLPKNDFYTDEYMDKQARRYTNDTAEQDLPKQRKC